MRPLCRRDRLPTRASYQSGRILSSNRLCAPLLHASARIPSRRRTPAQNAHPRTAAHRPSARPAHPSLPACAGYPQHMYAAPQKGKPPGGDPAAPVRRRSCRGAGSATAGVGRYAPIWRLQALRARVLRVAGTLVVAVARTPVEPGPAAILASAESAEMVLAALTPVAH